MPDMDQTTFRMALASYVSQPDARLREHERAQAQTRLSLMDREGMPLPYSRDTMAWWTLHMQQWHGLVDTPVSRVIVERLTRDMVPQGHEQDLSMGYA